MAEPAFYEYVCEADRPHNTTAPPKAKQPRKCPVAWCSKPLIRVGAGSRTATKAGA